MPPGIFPAYNRSPVTSFEGLRQIENFLKDFINKLDKFIIWFLPMASNPSTLILIKLFMLLLILRASSILYTIGRSKSVSNFSQMNHARYIAGQHSWDVVKDNVLFPGLDPHYCTVCRDVANGFSEGTVQCSICSSRVHRKCLSKKGYTSLPCKAIHREQLGPLLPIPSASSVEMMTPHQWFRCNIKIGNLCSCCGIEFRAERADLQGYFCPGCRAEVHEICLERSLHSYCDLGRNRKIILPPISVFESKKRFSQNGRFKMNFHSVPAGANDSNEKSSKSSFEQQNSKTSWSTVVLDGLGRRGLKPSRIKMRPKVRETVLDIDPLAIPEDVTPLAVLVNTRSGAGARTGQELLKKLRGLLNPLQVADLGSEDPFDFLRRFSKITKLRVLCCGGDGTVGWVLNAIDKVSWENGPPALAVLPLGTGNDLARTLGWGPGYEGTGDLDKLLDKVRDAREVMVDRWSVEMVPLKAKGKGAKSVPMGNYMGIGVDGQVALEFHRMREAHSHFFVSRLLNKVIYAFTGLRNVIFPSCQNLRNYLELYCDGQFIPLPELTESVILLNINSYAGGSKLWTQETSSSVETSSPFEDRTWVFGSPSNRSKEQTVLKYSPNVNLDCTENCDDLLMGDTNFHESSSDQSFFDHQFGQSKIDDGMLEVVAVTGVLHLGIIQVGIGAGHTVAQGRELRVRTLRTLPMQVDGEPWRQPPSDMIVQRHPQALMLSPATPEEDQLKTMISFNENVLRSALKKGMVSQDQSNMLMREASIIASETRRRKQGNKYN